MLDNNYISSSPRNSIFLESLKGVLFYTIFVLYGFLRLARVVFLFSLNFVFRTGLTILFYGSLLVIISLALVIVLSYYLIAVFGSEIHLP